MKIENPFESGHIRNYIMAYVAVVVIMVLFFIASTLWNDVKTKPKKEFSKAEKKKVDKAEDTLVEKTNQNVKIKMIDTVYDN